MRKADRRVERTRQMLLGALVSLVRERGFEALTVQDIIDRANVGRATFYAHFDNKEDLLVSGLEEFRASIRETQRRLLRQQAGSVDHAFLFGPELFAHMDAHREVFRAMVGKHSGAVVQRLFQKILVDLVREERKAIAPRSANGTTSVEVVVEYIAGGLWAMASWWLDAKVRPSVEEIDALFRRLAIPTLKASLR